MYRIPIVRNYNKNNGNKSYIRCNGCGNRYHHIEIKYLTFVAMFDNDNPTGISTMAICSKCGLQLLQELSDHMNLETIFDAQYARDNLDLNLNIPPLCLKHIQDNKRIQAIKEYRIWYQTTYRQPISLRQAKEFVDEAAKVLQRSFYNKGE